MEKKKILTKAGKIAANVLLYIFIAICLIGVILTITAKQDADGTVTFFGRQMRIVLSSSMEKCDATDVSGYDIKDIPVNSIVFIETVPEDEAEATAWYEGLEEGDVLTFKYVYVKQETITHRITGIDHTRGLIRLEGDNKDSDANTLEQTINYKEKNSPNYVIGKVTGTSYLLGLFVYMLKSPVGIVCIVILPSLIILFFEVLKIFRLLTEGQRKKEQAERDLQMKELDELKRRLAELEGGGASVTAPTEGAENPPTENNG